MSFLNSVLSSIDTGDVSLTPPPTRKNRDSDSSALEKIPATKSNSNGHSVSGQKRKAWDGLRPNGRAEKVSKPGRPIPNKHSPPAPKSTMTSRLSSNAPINARPSTNTSKPPNITATPSKPPPKGSYADIMLQAKALQGKAPANVGMIRHQSVSKEKLSRAQQKRLAEEAKQRELKNKKSSLKSGNNVGGGGGGGKVKEAILKSRLEKEATEPTYKGTARPPPRYKTTASSTEPAYTGTAGLPPRRGLNKTDAQTRRNQGRRPVRDEYLGTDEEDEGDFDDGDEGDYYSDASSDMEAAYTDMEQEERQALRIAKKEDDEELKLELAAKKEKMERKKKLAALATKSRH